ncbi:MAG: 4Fe-4S binding protein [Eubacteriales bacterium]|nr:4Fe-4S binding protein [Eubacteriales bacterium]
MLRKIIHIDEEKCNGCGACASACHEGAIAMIKGKARLIRDDYCDGLGDCLPACPAGAIAFQEREALPYNNEAVLAAKSVSTDSCLAQWPVQIKLVPTQAPYFKDAHLLIAADCTAFSYREFHKDFMAGRITLMGCPKLDMTNYSQKLAEILRENTIQSIAVARMEVPCCRGLEAAISKALDMSGKSIPLTVHVIGTDGRLR